MSRVLKGAHVNIAEDSRRLAAAYYPAHYQPEPEVIPEEPVADPQDEVDKIIAEAHANAKQLIHDAEFKAEGITYNAEAEAAQLKEQARRDGHTQGYQEGLAKGTAEGENIKHEAQALYERTIRERDEIIEQTEPAIVELVMKLVEKLTTDISMLEPGVVVNLIKQGLNDATITGKIIIHVSEADFDTVNAKKDDIKRSVEGGVDIEIVKDLSMQRLDCIIETAFGNIDCSLDGQLTQLKTSLKFILAAH